jgi:rhodanese-related sulfurtransferase
MKMKNGTGMVQSHLDIICYVQPCLVEEQKDYLMELSALPVPIRLYFCVLVLVPVAGLADGKPFAPASIDGVQIVTAEEAIDLILENPDMPVIDSRKKTEYVKGHIEGAVSLLDTEMTERVLQELAPDRESTILFYCNGVRCLRSSNAIRKALDWGYTSLVWFRGGWKEWTDKRLPVVTE